MLANLSRRSAALWARHARPLHSTSRLSDFHFDTHHFVQRLEREGLNRAQAEGIMSAMAEVIDESIRNMTANMVTKAEQEKVRPLLSRDVTRFTTPNPAPIYPTSRFCPNQIRTPAHGEERPSHDQSRE